MATECDLVWIPKWPAELLVEAMPPWEQHPGLLKEIEAAAVATGRGLGLELKGRTGLFVAEGARRARENEEVELWLFGGK